MKDQTKCQLTGFSTLAGVCAFSAMTASAQISLGETFYSTNGALAFQETGTPFGVEYRVDVLDSISISVAAFSFFDPFGQGGEGGFTIFGPWNSTVRTEAQWNDVNNTIPVSGNFVSSSEIGSFDELFGEVDDRVIIFYDFGGEASLNELNDADQALWADGAPSFIRTFGEISTEGLFLDGSGAVVASTVPEPAVSMLVGLAGIGLAVRRRK